MDSGIAVHDLTTLTAFQEELHGTYNKDDKPKTDEDAEDDDIVCVFARQFHRTSWYSHMSAPLQCTGENPFTFSVNNTFHFVKYLYLVDGLPALRVKREFQGRVRIAWPPYPAHNIVNSLVFDVDGSRFGYLDSHIIDSMAQYTMGYCREHYDMMVGNVDMLTKWSTFLPEYPLQLPLPFDIARDPSHAFPILYTNTKSNINIILNMRNKIVDLLKMERLTERTIEVREEKNGEVKLVKQKSQYWKPIPCALEYLEGVSASGTIRKPELWGRYAYLTEKELNWWRKCNDVSNVQVEEIIDTTNAQEPEKVKLIHWNYFIDDFVGCDDDNEKSYGETAAVSLSGRYPTRAVFFFAENMTARKNRNFSNYTTNVDDLAKGWDPCARHTLQFGDTKRLDDVDSIHSANVECLYHAVNPPRDPGYHLIAFSDRLDSLDADLGIVMDAVKARFSVKLGNTDPMLKQVMGDESRFEELENLNQEEYRKGGPQFILRVRMLITRKLSFVYNTKTKLYKFYVR